MSSKKNVHYSIDAISQTGANITLIYGERSNGKSYQVKHKKGILRFLNDTEEYFASYKEKTTIIKNVIHKGSRFILMRRLKEEITSEKIEAYFADVNIYDLTNGDYNTITLYRKTLYLANYNTETGKTIRGAKIGYVVALSTEQNYAGASYLDVTDIIFEEFMTRTTYLPNEPDKLMNFYSTVDRKRGTTKLWLVGNSISRVCPYIYEWGLHKIINNMKQGDIEEVWIPTGEIDDDGIEIEVKLAIEFCRSTGRSSFAIGKHKDMLNKGSWQSDPQPHLQHSYNDYTSRYKIGFQYQGFRFLAEYLQYNVPPHNAVWFVHQYNYEFKDNILVFSDEIRQSKKWQRDIYNIQTKNRKLQTVLNTFRETNIFYSTDLVGTDFKQVIDFLIRK